MASFQPFRNRRMKISASVRKSFSEDVFQSVKSLLQSEKELCSVSAEDSLKQDERAKFSEVTFLGFNEETDAAHIQDLAAVSLELPALLNSLHFCSLNENEIICMKDINKSESDVNSDPLNQSHSGMLCVMRVSPTLPRLRIDFLFSLLSKYATGIRYTLDSYLRQKRQLESANEDEDDTNHSVSSIEDDFVTAFEQLEEEEASRPYNEGINVAALRSQCDAASQTVPGRHVGTQDVKILDGSWQQKSSAKASAPLMPALGHKELTSVKTSFTASVSEPWTQRTFYRSSAASGKGGDAQKTLFSSSPAYSSESECSSPSPIIFLDEEGYQKSLTAKLDLPKLPVMKDDIEDSDSEVSEFFDSFDQFDELEQTLETACPCPKEPNAGKPARKKGRKHGKSCSVTTTMNPQKFKFDRPALPANVKKPTPRKPESPYSGLCDAPDSPRPVKAASGEDSGLFSPIRSSAFSPLGGCPPGCFCQTESGGDGVHGTHDTVHCMCEDYADILSCEVLDSVLQSQPTNVTSDTKSMEKEEKKPPAPQCGGLDPKSDSKNRPLMIKDSIQKFAADLVEKSFGSAFKDLQKGVSSCTNALCHLAIKLTSSVFQMAFNELKSQRAFSLSEHAISGLASFLVSEALSNAFQDLRYVKKQIFTSTVARFAADLAEELVFEGLMEVCQFSCPPTPASPQCRSFDFEDNVVKSYAKDLSESVIQEAFIELSQIDVAFTTKAAVSVSTDNITCVSAAAVPLTPASSAPPSPSAQTAALAKPAQGCEREYTVQQALFCTSGVATSIPVPVAGSALLPYRLPPKVWQTGPACLLSDGTNSHGEGKPAHVTSKRKEEEGACPRNICEQSSPRGPIPRNDNPATQDASEFAGDAGMISSFSAAMVQTVVNECLESVTSFKVTKPVDGHTDGLMEAVSGSSLPLRSGHADLPRSEADKKDMFADMLCQSIIRHSIDKSKSVILNVDKNLMYRDGLSAPGAESRLALGRFPTSPDAHDHLTPSLSLGKKRVPDSVAPGFSLETLALGPALTDQNPDLKELAQDKSGEKHSLNSPALESLCLGQENPFPPSRSFPSTVLACVDGLHVEDKQKAREGNAIPDTPPSTPLVPSQASSEWDIKKLTKKLKGELANEFAPATPPSTPHNASVGGLSGNEQHTIEKEEFLLKLMRSLSEEVESSEGEERSEDAKPEDPGEKIQFAEALATNIVSLATEAAASHLDHKTAQEPRGKSPCFNVHHQRCRSPAFLSPSEGTFQAVCNFAGDMAAEVITDMEKIAKVRSCMLSRPKNGCDGDRDPRTGEKLGVETVAPSREVDPFFLSCPSSSCLSGLTYKYPSCESVTDEYAGHVLQTLRQEGGNSELLMDQYANRLAYRSVKSGLQEAAKTAERKRSSDTLQSAQVTTHGEPFMFLSKECHQEAAKKRPSRRNGGCFHKIPACERTQERRGCELYSFSTSLAHSITKDVKKELTASAAGLPKSLTDSCLYEKAGCDDDTESHTESEFSRFPRPPSDTQRFDPSAGSLAGCSHGKRVVQAIEQYAQKVADATLELSLGPTVLHRSETADTAERITHAEKLSPLPSQSCRFCDRKELQDCTGSSAQHLFQQGALAGCQAVGNSRHGSFFPKPKIFHLDVPQIHVGLDRKVVLAEKIVAEAIEKAERELSNTSLAGDSGIGQDGISFAESLSTDIMTSVMTSNGHVSSLKEIEDIHSAESFGSQQMNVSIGEDSIGSWSNLSFEDDHQDESSSFHHLSESDGPDDEEDEDDAEGLAPDGKTLLITNIDMEPSTVDPQLRIILQWLIASEAEVAELYFHDSATKEFIRLSKQLQIKGWKVGDLLQAVLKYYEVMEKISSEERCKSLFDWLLENA